MSELEFWQAVYIACVRSEHLASARIEAQEAVEAMREDRKTLSLAANDDWEDE